MNVKSRAQLIVWCLPHLGFVENDARAAQNEIKGQNAAINNNIATMPVGNATVGGATVNPMNNDNKQGSGNSDIGAFGI